MRIWRFGALVISAFVLGGPALSAHHSFAAFDMKQEKTITGVVSRFDWTNPHTFIWVDWRCHVGVDVPNEKGVIESWGIEGMSPNYLGRRGWSKHSVKPGEKITVTIHPLKEGKTGGMFMRAQIGDRTLMPTGAPTDAR